MKNIYSLFIVLFVGIQLQVYAQTGIGTNSPNEQAILEIQSVDKGVLFPSISLTSTTTFLGGISATASHTNMLVYNTNTSTTTSGLDGTGYYFWNGINWEKITGDTDNQSLAEVTAIGNTTLDIISVGGVLDSGALTVVGDADLQGDIDLGDTYLDNISILGTINTDLLFQAGKSIASPTSALVAIYSSELKPGSGDDLSIDTNSTSERINFSNNGAITAGVNSSTFFVGDISGPNHYKLPSGTASRAPGQVLTLDSTSEQLYFNSTLSLPTATNDGATLRWDTAGNEWQESTDLRIAPNSSSDVWINQNLLPSSTLIDIGQSGNNFDEVYADQFISSQNSVTFGTNNGTNKMYLKFEGDPPGSLVLNESQSINGGNANTAFGFRTLLNATSSDNNNTAFGFFALNGNSSVGSNNVAVGDYVLSVNTGSDNVGVGGTALTNNTGGVENVAVGSAALSGNTIGQYNVALGRRALLANTSGDSNIAIGKESMITNTTGDNNIIIGNYSDVSTSSLENAIAIGYNTTVNASNTMRLGNNDIESIISSGTLTLDGVTYPNTTGTAGQVLTVSSTTENLYFSTIPTLPASFDDGATLRWNLSSTEWEATTDFRIAPGTGYSLPNAIWIEESIIPSSTINLGQSGNEFNQTFTEEVGTSTNVLTLTTNAQSVYLKRNTLNFTLTNDQEPFPAGFKGNIGFGIDVFNSASTTPNNNVAVGYTVLEDITSGSNNIAFGSETLRRITSGTYNIAMGNRAGNYLTTASQTIVIGDNAGSLLTGSNNIAVGYRAMYGSPSSSGYDNIGIGNYVLRRVANAYGNVALGHDSMENLTSGNSNVAVGDNSMNSITTGSNNIAIGDGALNTLTTGSGNIAIGENADVNGSTTTNAIAIGKDAEVKESNSIRLGNTNISSIISSGTLTLDQVTYPNITGTAGQVLTVSSTTDYLYFSGNSYMLADTSAAQTLATAGGFFGNFQDVSSTADMAIATTSVSSDTFRLTGGKAYKLTAYVNVSNFNSGSQVQYQFWENSSSTSIGVKGLTINRSGDAVIIAPATAIIYAASTTSIRLSLTNSTKPTNIDQNATYIIIESL